MGTQVYFNGKLRKLPGAYSTITSGEQNAPRELEYGKVLIIDTGLAAGWGGGAGSTGTFASNKDAVYSFTNLDDFRSFIKGGLLWKIAEALFFPYPGVAGVSTLYYTKAATTASAAMTFTVARGANSGTANVTLAGGLTKLATWNASVPTTRGDFVTAHAPAYGAQNILLTGADNDLIFTAATPGVPFVSPIITNATGALNGTVVHTQPNVYAVTQVETITLTGTSGTANVGAAGGLTKLVTYGGGSLTATAAAFVVSHATAYDGQGIVCTSIGEKIILTDKVPGTGFTAPTITNASLTLAGTVAHTTANVAPVAQVDTITLNANAVGGTFVVNLQDEGVIGNGVLTTTHLDKGYAFTITAGTTDPAKFIFNIWQGAWKGDHTDGVAYDEVPKASSTPILVIQSPEFDNMQTLLDWANSDIGFGRKFKLGAASSATGGGIIISTDVTSYATYNVATGGTEVYAAGDLTNVFNSIVDLDYQFILSDVIIPTNYNVAPTSSIISHILDPATEFIKTLIFAGGADEATFTTQTLVMGPLLNSNRVILVHGSVKKTSRALASGFRVWPALYHAAVVLGRICGLEPQVPITNKQISVEGLVHNLTKKEQERALDKGVIVTITDNYRGGFKVLQGVNTIQDNTVLFTAQGKSHSIQFERVTAQINRELVINSERDLLSQENGVNANTLSPGLLKTWTETYLANRVATPLVDNLLLSFRNVTVTRVDDNYMVTYGIVVNNEITKIFYTGYLFKS